MDPRAACSWDGDGDLDVGTSSYHDARVGWFPNDGGGLGWEDYYYNRDSQFVTSGDVNNDGLYDIVSAASYST